MVEQVINMSSNDRRNSVGGHGRRSRTTELLGLSPSIDLENHRQIQLKQE